LNPALHSVSLITNNLELVLQLAQSPRRKSQILLSTPYFLCQTTVFSQQLLYAYLICLRLFSSVI
jgi:hypothetical protein